MNNAPLLNNNITVQSINKQWETLKLLLISSVGSISVNTYFNLLSNIHPAFGAGIISTATTLTYFTQVDQICNRVTSVLNMPKITKTFCGMITLGVFLYITILISSTYTFCMELGGKFASTFTRTINKITGEFKILFSNYRETFKTALVDNTYAGEKIELLKGGVTSGSIERTLEITMSKIENVLKIAEEQLTALLKNWSGEILNSFTTYKIPESLPKLLIASDGMGNSLPRFKSNKLQKQANKAITAVIKSSVFDTNSLMENFSKSINKAEPIEFGKIVSKYQEDNVKFIRELVEYKNIQYLQLPGAYLNSFIKDLNVGEFITGQVADNLKGIEKYAGEELKLMANEINSKLSFAVSSLVLGLSNDIASTLRNNLYVSGVGYGIDITKPLVPMVNYIGVNLPYLNITSTKFKEEINPSIIGYQAAILMIIVMFALISTLGVVSYDFVIKDALYALTTDLDLETAGEVIGGDLSMEHYTEEDIDRGQEINDDDNLDDIINRMGRVNLEEERKGEAFTSFREGNEYNTPSRRSRFVDYDE